MLDKLVVHHVVHQPHAEQKLTARMIEILVGWEVVANVVASLPASK